MNRKVLIRHVLYRNFYLQWLPTPRSEAIVFNILLGLGFTSLEVGAEHVVGWDGFKNQAFPLPWQPQDGRNGFYSCSSFFLCIPLTSNYSSLQHSSLQRLVVDPHQIKADQITLTPAQHHYLHRVLRLVTGNRFVVLDGQGQQWVAALTSSSDLAEIVTIGPSPEVPGPALTLAIALPKGSGFDEVVRQATELGVTTIQPVLTERTLNYPNAKKLERWQRIAVEATEQSERLWLPHILEPLPWLTYLTQLPSGSRWLCVTRQAAPHLLVALQSQTVLGDLLLATGPEGGWTELEISAALAQKFQPVSLGSQILRAVTAPLAALAIATAARAGMTVGESPSSE
ncbi:MAG: 16S rRNA (uracil(1498)-N(3))-methyltransferase [Leptolyngbyaceae cyanobacterium SM2_3_12]|nr:16S rRNA (uracil(1498)-N(3))-methyltransferase [Leptolyngbyaceae cyanobacterium SM2_3_12]